MSESLRHMWVLSLNHCAAIPQAMTQLSGVTYKSNEQHIELGSTRRSQNYKDCQKFLSWLQQQNPFSFEDEHLHSLSSRLFSKTSIDQVNCEEAEELGFNIHKQLDSLQFISATVRRKDQLHALDSLCNSVKIEGKAVSINQTLLFTRLTAIAQREEEGIEQYFTHEMTTEPLVLFKHRLM